MSPMRRGASRQQRRTNWFGSEQTGFDVAAGATESVILIDPSDAAREESNYVAATLTRVRGKVTFDPDLGTGDFNSTQQFVAHAVLFCDRALGSYVFNSNFLGDDAVLWHGLWTLSYRNQVSGTTPTSWAQPLLINHWVWDVDTKAQRKLEDVKQLRWVFHVSADSSAGGHFNWGVRSLLKE